jgi:hypothetical protein
MMILMIMMMLLMMMRMMMINYFVNIDCAIYFVINNIVLRYTFIFTTGV